MTRTLPQLDTLILRRTQVEDLGFSSTLVNLKTLDISLTKVNDFTPIAALKYLQVLMMREMLSGTEGVADYLHRGLTQESLRVVDVGGNMFHMDRYPVTCTS